MADDRRNKIVEILTRAANPVSGSDLAKQLGVSRQVIVQDVAILRARGCNVMATPQGYILPKSEGGLRRAVLAVKHSPRDTREELNILVDHGLKVLDVLVEHPYYGELRGYLMLESRRDVKRFVEMMESEGATLLSSLTNGVHLHTVEYRRKEDLEEAKVELRKRGFWAGD